MKLSELKTGEKGIIVKVLGHGGFRKRIVEMGFIKGKEVEVLLNAPLQDPVKYKIIGYEISLRRSEAELIEVVTHQEVSNETFHQTYETTHNSDNIPQEDMLQAVAMKKLHTINIALVGNPNSGKTSLFNFISGAHEHVGNYSGVTVDAKVGHVKFKGYTFNIVDLPGTYSLSAYSPEELYVRKQIIDHTPDIIVNVVDAGNLERNLYLTTQLIDINLPLVCALNMFDEFEKNGDQLNVQKLEQLFGIPMIPTIFKSGKGVEQLFQTIINQYEGTVSYRHTHVNHGQYVEQAINNIRNEVIKTPAAHNRYSARYLSIKLLEKDKDVEQFIQSLSNSQTILDVRNKQVKILETDTKEDSETLLMDSKYGFINGALQEAGYEKGDKHDNYKLTRAIDKLVTHRLWGFPMFFLFLYIMFKTTFTLGEYPMNWIDMGVAALGDFVSANMPEGPLKAMLVEGIIGGVGAVIVFLPQILILYTFISFMEDSGYMARAAFIMDKLMHKMGLHGKSFIPLIMGFGCNVPAIMSTRTIESRRSRLITMLVLPLMSCQARLPIYIMIIGIFFPPQYSSLAMFSLYLLGIALAVLMSRLFSNYIIKGDNTPFVMELPPYRFPTTKAIVRHTWEKGKQYLKKMGGIILMASILVWALGYFPHQEHLSTQEQKEQSYIGQVGKAMEPVFKPLGFDWKLDVSLLAGVIAKEVVASTISVLYTNDESVPENEEEVHQNSTFAKLRINMVDNGIDPLTAYAYLVFVLIYFPCIATVVAIKNESGSWKWAGFSIVYTCLLAWTVSWLIRQVGQFFIS